MMRNPNHKVDRYRLPAQGGCPATKKGDAHGLFSASFKGAELCIMSSGLGPVTNWEHVSVSLSDRCPTWPEMCFVKHLFWHSSEIVIQFHPAKAAYVNTHQYCLHLWRHRKGKVMTPPLICI